MEGCLSEERRGRGQKAKKGRSFLYCFFKKKKKKKPTQENTHAHNQRLFPSRNINRAESNTVLSSKCKKVKEKATQGFRLRPLGTLFGRGAYKEAAGRGFVQLGVAARRG